ncbi:MAG: DUF2188 domain-containing protein [Angustibacter sp.]
MIVGIVVNEMSSELAVRKVYRVVPSGSVWELKHDGVVLSTHHSKDVAVSTGQTTAKANEPSQLVVHRADGTIEFEYTYDDDPYPPKG